MRERGGEVREGREGEVRESGRGSNLQHSHTPFR